MSFGKVGFFLRQRARVPCWFSGGSTCLRCPPPWLLKGEQISKRYFRSIGINRHVLKQEKAHMSLQQCKLGNGQAPYTEAAAKASAVRSHWRGQGASRCFSKRWELVPNVSLNETTRPKYPWNTRGSKSVVVQPVGSPVLMKGMTPSPWAAKTTRGQRDGAFKDGTGTGRTVAGLDLWSEVRCIKMCCHYFWSLWSNLFLCGNSESLGGWGPGTFLTT